MSEEKVNYSGEELHKLITKKLQAAGYPEEQANEMANHLVYAEMTGVHSHGSVRVEYYAERVAKGGVNTDPDIEWEKTGPSSAIMHGDDGNGMYVADLAVEPTIELAKESGIAVVGMESVSHTGTLSYYLRKIAHEGLFAMGFTNSDPMSAPTGGTEPFFGTNPIAFAAPKEEGEPVVFDMATTVQAWGKVLSARASGEDIPSDWGIDENGDPTTDPHAIAALNPISGAKGYGLQMLVDTLAAVLLGLPNGKHTSSMYDDLGAYRKIGQTYIVIDPERFVGLEQFKKQIQQTVDELHAVEPADWADQVYYPGEGSVIRYERYKKEGVKIPKDIADYLESDDIHYDNYEGKGPFA